MRKGSGTKTVVSITIDKKVLKELKLKLSKKMIKLSNYIEYLIVNDKNK